DRRPLRIAYFHARGAVHEDQHALWHFIGRGERDGRLQADDEQQHQDDEKPQGQQRTRRGARNQPQFIAIQPENECKGGKGNDDPPRAALRRERQLAITDWQREARHALSTFHDPPCHPYLAAEQRQHREHEPPPDFARRHSTGEDVARLLDVVYGNDLRYLCAILVMTRRQVLCFARI